MSIASINLNKKSTISLPDQNNSNTNVTSVALDVLNTPNSHSSSASLADSKSVVNITSTISLPTELPLEKIFRVSFEDPDHPKLLPEMKTFIIEMYKPLSKLCNYLNLIDVFCINLCNTAEQIINIFEHTLFNNEKIPLADGRSVEFKEFFNRDFLYVPIISDILSDFEIIENNFPLNEWNLSTEMVGILMEMISAISFFENHIPKIIKKKRRKTRKENYLKLQSDILSLLTKQQKTKGALCLYLYDTKYKELLFHNKLNSWKEFHSIAPNKDDPKEPLRVAKYFIFNHLLKCNKNSLEKINKTEHYQDLSSDFDSFHKKFLIFYEKFLSLQSYNPSFLKKFKSLYHDFGCLVNMEKKCLHNSITFFDIEASKLDWELRITNQYPNEPNDKCDKFFTNKEFNVLSVYNKNRIERLDRLVNAVFLEIWSILSQDDKNTNFCCPFGLEILEAGELVLKESTRLEEKTSIFLTTNPDIQSIWNEIKNDSDYSQLKEYVYQKSVEFSTMIKKFPKSSPSHLSILMDDLYSPLDSDEFFEKLINGVLAPLDKIAKACGESEKKTEKISKILFIAFEPIATFFHLIKVIENSINLEKQPCAITAYNEVFQTIFAKKALQEAYQELEQTSIEKLEKTELSQKDDLKKDILDCHGKKNKKLLSILAKNGFQIQPGKGSHVKVKNAEGKTTTIPQQLKKGTLNAIYRQVTPSPI